MTEHLYLETLNNIVMKEKVNKMKTIESMLREENCQLNKIEKETIKISKQRQWEGCISESGKEL